MYYKHKLSPVDKRLFKQLRGGWFKRNVVRRLQILFGYCPRHNAWFKYRNHYRRNTAYIDKELNYGYAPQCCIDEDNEDMAWLWADYYQNGK